jgi:hypothetical protein
VPWTAETADEETEAQDAVHLEALKILVSGSCESKTLGSILGRDFGQFLLVAPLAALGFCVAVKRVSMTSTD